MTFARTKPRKTARVVEQRYEMLRLHRVEGWPVSAVAARYGVSRQTFYKLARAFEQQGILGLVPRRSGPRQGYKCTPEIIDFATKMRVRKKLALVAIAEEVRRRFRVELSPSTIRMALAKVSARAA